MAIQPEDQKTADIFEHPMMTDEATQQRIADQKEELHLAAEHKLVKVQAFVRNEVKAEKKTKTAERVQKFREGQKAAGLMQVAIPKEVAEAVKATDGGFTSWLAAQKTAPIERIVEVQKEVPAALTSDQLRLIAVGRAVESATGWRRSILRALLR